MFVSKLSGIQKTYIVVDGPKNYAKYMIVFYF